MRKGRVAALDSQPDSPRRSQVPTDPAGVVDGWTRGEDRKGKLEKNWAVHRVENEKHQTNLPGDVTRVHSERSGVGFPCSRKDEGSEKLIGHSPSARAVRTEPAYGVPSISGGML